MESSGQQTPKRALADLQLNAILAADHGTSSEDEDPDIFEDDLQTALGISIGREQTRLTSPKTPAVEKSAAIDRAGGFFVDQSDSADVDETSGGRDLDGTIEWKGSNDHDARSSPRASPTRPGPRMPSPWRAGPKVLRRSSVSRKALQEDSISNRKRASSGPETMLESWQRSMRGTLPSLPKNITFPFHFGRENAQMKEEAPNGPSSPSRQPHQRSIYANTVPAAQQGHLSTARSSGSIGTAASSQIMMQRSSEDAVESPTTLRRLPSHLEQRNPRNRPLYLRRSTSDNSLMTQRTMSRVSSLGDDTRWEEINQQVNSRFKAIKDSLQDSSIRLPSMPSISNFSVASFTPDFLRERSSSLSQKSNRVDDTAQHMKPVDPMTRQPYSSAKAALADASVDKTGNSHPNLHRAMQELEGDVVILGGYRGSILRSAEPPHRQLWIPIKVGLNLRKVDLEVGIQEGDDERAAEKVIPDGMLTHIAGVDISRRLLKRLRHSDNARSGKLRVHNYGYDWRLDPHHLSAQLISFLEDLPGNRSREEGGVTVIAHSLGGLITRHAVNQRPDLFSGVVYAGVPQNCINILGPLRNGDEVLLSSRVLTAQVNFTIRTSFALLPLDGRCFLDKTTKEEYPVDFFDPQTWIDYRLSPCVGRALPPLTAPPKPTGIAGYVASLPSLPVPGRKRNSFSWNKSATTAAGAAAPDTSMTDTRDMAAESHSEPNSPAEMPPSVRTTVTLPREDAIEYLTRTLASVKRFKEQLAFNPAHHDANRYPPIGVLYGKSTPTVFGARVDGRECIKHADAYDELAFASGDGVVLAKAAMVPTGYRVARGGVVSSERGHVTLLGDLEAVGKALLAVFEARRRGVGLGRKDDTL